MNKKILILFAVLLLMLRIILISSSENENKIDNYVYEGFKKNNEVKVIVEIKEPAIEKGNLIKTPKTLEEIESEKKEIKKDIEEKIDDKINHDFGNEIAIEVSKEELIELKNNLDVEKIKVDKPVKAFLTDSIPLINASTVWAIKISNLNITGIDETICIIDTGINFSHADLIGKNKTCVIDCVGKACVENCSISDDNGHGTHVAGIAGANGVIKGVAVESKLIGVKALDASGSGSDSDLRAGINWCIANSLNYNISVISMSLGTDCDLTPQYCYNTYCDYDWTDTAIIIDNATANNISVIIATGNDGNTAKISAPACIKNATAVGATNKDDTFASYSNRNNMTDLVAPGTSISSTKSSGGYETRSGTSMATPHVTGAFVLIREFFKLQYNKNPTVFEILNILNSTGKQINDTSGNGLIYSRIDVYSALISNDSSSPSVNLTSPANATIQFNASIIFKCSANDVLLSNISLYIWNSTGNIVNITTKTISGINAEKEFNLNLSSGDYKWNCLAYDSKSKSSFASLNFTISYDIINSNITIISPADASSYSSNLQSITFNYNISDNLNISNCSLIVNGIINMSNSSITNLSETQGFIQNFAPGNYNWSINCTNSAGNSENSNSRSFVVNAPAVVVITSSGGSSGGGSGGSLSTTYTPNITETSNDEIPKSKLEIPVNEIKEIEKFSKDTGITGMTPKNPTEIRENIDSLNKQIKFLFFAVAIIFIIGILLIKTARTKIKRKEKIKEYKSVFEKHLKPRKRR